MGCCAEPVLGRAGFTGGSIRAEHASSDQVSQWLKQAFAVSCLLVDEKSEVQWEMQLVGGVHVCAAIL